MCLLTKLMRRSSLLLCMDVCWGLDPILPFPSLLLSMPLCVWCVCREWVCVCYRERLSLPLSTCRRRNPRSVYRQARLDFAGGTSVHNNTGRQGRSRSRSVSGRARLGQAVTRLKRAQVDECGIVTGHEEPRLPYQSPREPSCCCQLDAGAVLSSRYRRSGPSGQLSTRTPGLSCTG
jgi:hypothetical protein